MKKQGKTPETFLVLQNSSLKPHNPTKKQKTRPLFFKANEFSNCGGGPHQAIFSSELAELSSDQSRFNCSEQTLLRLFRRRFNSCITYKLDQFYQTTT